MEFPRPTLEEFAALLEREALGPWYLAGARDIRKAIKVYDELTERCVLDRIELSLQIATLRARLRDVDPFFEDFAP